MEEYVDHNTSITVHVRDNEWDDVAKWIDDNKDWIVGISFLSLDDNFYQLAPYEEITKEVYEEMVANMKHLNLNLLAKYETGEELDAGTDGCEAGVCPIR
jgi:ribonucleoside-diphosphate reductase alpha chain/ribonucleoside-triphosphate reductase